MDASENLLHCPVCGTQLSFANSSVDCPHCKKRFPIFDGIPCLIAECEGWALDASAGVEVFRSAQAREIQSLREQLSSRKVFGESVKRVEARLAAKERYKSLFDQLYSAFPNPSSAPRPNLFRVDRYYENLLRDWVWGADENAEALRRVSEVFPDDIPANLLVFGAGACRLALDLHREKRIPLTVAIDNRPTLMLAAARLLRGEKLEIPEFPRHPLSIAGASRVHPAEASVDTGPGRFIQVFADAFAPPIREEKASAILTPWFVDIVPMDFRSVAYEINRRLEGGGTWLNTGPLTFGTSYDRPSASAYTLEEVLAIVRDSGFEFLREPTVAPMTYLRSPDSGQHLQEHVLTFAAKKIAKASTPVVPRASALPVWYLDVRSAIPAGEPVVQMRSLYQAYNEVLSQVDGKTSVAQIAERLGKRISVDPKSMERELADLILTALKGG